MLSKKNFLCSFAYKVYDFTENIIYMTIEAKTQVDAVLMTIQKSVV